MTEYVLFSVALLVGCYFFFVGLTRRGAGFNQDLPEPLKSQIFGMLRKLYYIMALLLALSAVCFYLQIFGSSTRLVSIILVLLALVCPMVYAVVFRKKFNTDKMRRAEMAAARAEKKRLREQIEEEQPEKKPKKKQNNSQKYSRNYTKKSKNRGK